MSSDGEHQPRASTGPGSPREAGRAAGLPRTTESGAGLVASLPPASFSFVMATGIVSTGLDLVGAVVPALILFFVAILGAIILAVMMLARLIIHGRRVIADLRSPGITFGLFTIVAAANVLSSRFDQYSCIAVALVLAALAAVIWLLLTYAIPAVLLFGRHEKSLLAAINGSWFLWIVGTQSLSITAAMAARVADSPFLAAAAAGLWGVGVALYLLIATLVTLRLVANPVDPPALGPTYWIYMGATAISVLAGSNIIALPADLPIMATAAPVVSGLSYVLWALGLWWIPLLVLFGIWRHLVHRYSLRYEMGFWSIVFPLGMYSTASMRFARVQGLDFMDVFGQILIWVATLAWIAATISMCVSGAQWWGRRRHRS